MLFNLKRITSMLIVFIMIFTYMGNTLEAVATTDALSVITNGFFNTNEIVFNAYFDENGSQISEKVSNVNENATLTFEVSPSDENNGFLKQGKIQANAFDQTGVNFKFVEIKNVVIDDPEVENTAEEENIVSLENEVISENIATNEAVEEIDNEVTSRTTQTRDVEDEIMLIDNLEPTNELINEEQVIQDATAEIEDKTYEKLTAKDFEIEITSDNEISLQNIIYNTKIEVEIEYNKKENLNISDLYKEIDLKLTGTYINVNLEKTEIERNQKLIIGWTYSKEIEVSGKYTQFSPFKLGDYTGIIVESKINVKREPDDEKYLPVKQTTVEIEVPDFAGKQPETVNVQATKLMATKGQQLGDVEFTRRKLEL